MVAGTRPGPGLNRRAMSKIDDIDFFTSNDLLVDPFPYFDALRARGPVQG